MLKLENVTKVYQTGKTSVQALNGVSLEITPAEFLIIRGPSGSGKSTLLNILGLLDSPTEGSVFLDGTKITYDDFDRLAAPRAHVMSFIFQAFNLNPVLTLEENVMIPLMIRKDIPRAEKRRRVAEWVEKVGLGSHRHHRPDELSGGQRQRVAIARAMVSLPRLVIADEPTANLDSKTSASILSLMRELSESSRTAFVFATHDPIFDAYAKRELFIKDGVIS